MIDHLEAYPTMTRIIAGLQIFKVNYGWSVMLSSKMADSQDGRHHCLISNAIVYLSTLFPAITRRWPNTVDPMLACSLDVGPTLKQHWFSVSCFLGNFNPLTAKLFNLNFHPPKLCLADAIHNFKWVKIIQIWRYRGKLFSNIADWCHILSLSHVWKVVLVC